MMLKGPALCMLGGGGRSTVLFVVVRAYATRMTPETGMIAQDHAS